MFSILLIQFTIFSLHLSLLRGLTMRRPEFPTVVHPQPLFGIPTDVSLKNFKHLLCIVLNVTVVVVGDTQADRFSDLDQMSSVWLTDSNRKQNRCSCSECECYGASNCIDWSIKKVDENSGISCILVGEKSNNSIVLECSKRFSNGLPLRNNLYSTVNFPFQGCKLAIIPP